MYVVFRHDLDRVHLPLLGELLDVRHQLLLVALQRLVLPLHLPHRLLHRAVVAPHLLLHRQLLPHRGGVSSGSKSRHKMFST